MAVFIIRDAAGNIVLDLSNSITKTLGYFTVEPGISQSITIPDLYGGRLWVSVSAEQIKFDIGVWSTPPSAVINGNTITVATTRDVRCFCVYGIY
ncbi:MULTISPECIES: hypothetical protein [Dickeya]|uniref:hypothetical protein n=1 Tax=Dickeya TaxID=204037 RepID=UPI000AA52944|nr:MULTISPECIES: hypothetical protein [Dickeya]